MTDIKIHIHSNQHSFIYCQDFTDGYCGIIEKVSNYYNSFGVTCSISYQNSSGGFDEYGIETLKDALNKIRHNDYEKRD